MTTDTEYIATASQALEEAWNHSINTEGWKQEKTDKKTEDVVESKKNSAGRRIYRCRAKVAMPPKLLVEALSDTDHITELNLTLQESKILKKLSDGVAISYQVTKDSGGGIVSSRDFIYCSKKEYKGDVFVMGGMSVEYDGMPPSSKIVRAHNGPGCNTVSPVAGDDNSCIFVWVMDCDFKGWMPQSVVDISMPIAQTQFIESVRALAKKLKAEGKF